MLLNHCKGRSWTSWNKDSKLKQCQLNLKQWKPFGKHYVNITFILAPSFSLRKVTDSLWICGRMSGSNALSTLWLDVYKALFPLYLLLYKKSTLPFLPALKVIFWLRFLIFCTQFFMETFHHLCN